MQRQETCAAATAVRRLGGVSVRNWSWAGSSLLLLATHFAYGQSAPAPVAAPAPAAVPAAAAPTPEGESKPPETVKPGDPPRSGETPKPGEPMKSEGDSGVISRPTTPPAQPNPGELKVQLDPHGKVRFNFRGQPWLEVVTWLAEISQMSLDWQELPADFLNLTTQRTYTVDEARDLVNRHLLARGFTLLIDGEVLNVVNLKKLDPALVPRVEPAELLRRMPHEFVKVSFELDSLLAEATVEELKPMLSPFGKLTSLKSTNRVEAMDAVINLRSLYKVLGDEQSTDVHDRVVREFELEHAKATEVQQQLLKLLGVEEANASRGGREGRGISPEQMQQMMQQQMEMMRQQQEGGRSRGGSSSSQKPEIYLVVNARRNSILAHAAPDKMALITQAVKMLDVPPEHAATLNGSLQRMQVYRLAALDPAVVAKLLEESGGLDPTTRVQVDERNRAIVVHGSLADQITIRAVIEKLDGSGRRFHVIPLRRLEADYVAGTIEFMMLGGGEEKQQSSRRGFFDFYDRGSRDRQDAGSDKLRIDADTENNRLLVWGNEIEIEEILSLLEKLGEVTERRQGGAATSTGPTTRVLSVDPERDPREVLERIQRIWPQLSPNPLLLPELPSRRPSKPTEERLPADSESEDREPADGKPVNKAPAKATAPSADKSTLQDSPARPRQPIIRAAQFTQQKEASADDADPAADEAPRPAAAPAPIRVGILPDGRLTLSSTDAEALDQLEQLLEEAAAPRKDYQVFHLKHARAYWVKMNIEEFFEEKDKDASSSRSRSFYFFDGPPPSKTEPRRRLSKRKQLKFVTDPDTNTLLVSGADTNQLRIISDLVELYDQPEPKDPKLARVTQKYQVQWSKAESLADAVKDVFRDLLSANDKALSQTPDQKNRPAPSSFKGKLSVGIDEISNTLLISTEGEELMESVLKMVRELDEAAKPSATIQVLKVEGSTTSQAVREALSEILTGEPADGARTSSGGASGRSNRPSGGRTPDGRSNPNRGSR